MTAPAVRLSWGRVPHAAPAHTVEPLSRSDSLPLRDDLHYLPYGNGRSYGDSNLNPGGGIVATRRLDRFIAWDAQTGRLQCESGVLLADIVRFALPQGWFPSVTPGTKFISVGGAIANDVHGKNHHVAGTFGHHVESLALLRSDGARLTVSRAERPDLFAATIGGLGLTGFITEATLQLKRVPGPWLDQETLRFGSLDAFFEIDAERKPKHEYTVAWVDCTAGGAQRGRGLYMAADHAPDAGGPARRGGTLRVPMDPPFSLIGPLTLRLFNLAYYNRPVTAGRQRVHYEPMFYPLDGIREWNRVYGPRGFYQFQCVVPADASRPALNKVLQLIADHGAGSFLAVLKTFGDKPSDGLLSFPRPGTTLALDFPFHGETTRKLFAEMEAVVFDAGGALYPAKDGMMSRAAFRAGYPAYERFRAHVDPRFSSEFARRVGLLEAA